MSNPGSTVEPQGSNSNANESPEAQKGLDKKKRTKKKSNRRKKELQSTQWNEILHGLNKLPTKTLGWLSLVSGGLIMVAYFNHIGYQPTMNAVDLPLLFGRALYAGAMVFVIFASLFVTLLLCSGIATKIDKTNRLGSALNWLGNVALIVLCHFGVITLAYAMTLEGTGTSVIMERYGLVAAWVVMFAILSYRRVRQIINEAKRKEVKLQLKMQKAGEISNTSIPQEKKKNGTLIIARIFGELIMYLFLCLSSAFPLLLLNVILDHSPAQAHVDDTFIFMAWLTIAACVGVIGTVPKIPLRGKFLMAGGAIVVILSIGQSLHLPLEAIARISGIGYVEHADLELSDTRCVSLKRQLTAEGMPNRLICSGDTQNATDLFPDVLKDVLLLNREGNEYYVQIPLVKHIATQSSAPLEGTSTGNQSPPAVTSKVYDSVSKPTAVQNEMKEWVLRFPISKVDAHEMIRMEEDISLQQYKIRTKKTTDAKKSP